MTLDHALQWIQTRKILGQTDAKFLAFTSLQVRFMVDSSSCSNNKSLTNAIVTMIPYFFDYRPRPRIVAAATRGRRTRKRRIIQTTVTGLAIGLFVLYNSFPWLTAELRAVALYYCQYLTVVAASLVRSLSSRH